MTSFATSSMRMLRRLIGRRPDHEPPPPGEAVVLDGLSAVAAIDTLASSAAALGATFPAAAGARLWDRAVAGRDVSQFKDVLGVVRADSPREALAAAIGLSMSGQRASVMLSGPDLAASQDLLSIAAGQHLPLVVHVACRGTPRHAQALGTGHRAYHAACDWGFFQFFATNVQEVCDLTLIARRAAERALVPGIVAMDTEQTAAAAQDVLLPDGELIARYLEDPSRAIEAPTDAQRMLFGDTRRLVPRLFDLDRPLMLSPLAGPESFAPGAAGARPYFDEHLPAILAEAINTFQEQTGRRAALLLEHATADAEVVLVVQGSAAETAIALATHLRRHRRIKLGVLGVRALRPFPAVQIARALAGVKIAIVLERADAPLAGDGPLLREVRAALARVYDPLGWEDVAPGDDPPPRSRACPALVNVVYGLGGAPCRAADLEALVATVTESARPRYYLGLEFARSSSAFPKHQALMDALRRSDERLATLGLRATEPGPDLRPEGSTTIAVSREVGPDHERLAGEAARLIHAAFGGQIRSRPALSWQRSSEPCADILTHAPEALSDPGDDVAIDMIVTTRTGPGALGKGLTDRLASGGCVLLVQDDPSAQACALAPGERARLQERACSLHVVPAPEDAPGLSGRSRAREEALLAGLIALLHDRAGRDRPTTSQARSLRESTLPDVPDVERSSRLDAFVAAYESITTIDVEQTTIAAPSAEADRRAAMTGAQPRPGETIDALSQFWDHAGVFYRSGETEGLSANPYLSMGAIPPLSSTLRDQPATSHRLPVFDPSTCDADPRLWTTCPDASLAPLVISARALINAGIDFAAAAGKHADALRAIAGQWARRANKIVASSEDPPTTAEDLLRAAFEDVLTKAQPDDDRRQTLRDALDAVIGEVGPLPLARTQLFFDDPETESPGSGELFSLIVNPDTCKSPEAVLGALVGRGIRFVERTDEAIASARRLHDLWRRLPDTPGSTIERVRHTALGPLAAIMLSRHCLHAMAGGDGAEAGSGAKLALRHALGIAEYHLQPRQQEHLQSIQAYRAKVAEEIREVLAAALPTDNIEALADGLRLLDRADFDLADLSQRIDSAVTGGRVDGERLARLVELARSLADMEWRLTKGPHGLGRARTGMAVAPGGIDAWVGAFPYNPLPGPVVVDASGETGPLAMGLLEGQLRQVLADVEVLRRARLEIDGATVSQAPLRFSDLAPDERAICPPMLLVGDGRTLGGRALAQVTWLLDSGLPVKIIVLSEAGGRIDSGLSVDSLGGYPVQERRDLPLLAMLTRKAYVVQTSLADPDHFAEGLSSALAFAGPALVQIHAPSPERHGFPVGQVAAQARLAVESRAVPLLNFDPARGGVFGSCIDLSGNPSPASRWVLDEREQPVTPAHWAATEARFAEHLQPAGADTPDPVPLAEYLDLAPDQRSGRTPSIVISEGEGERRVCIDGDLVADVEDRLRLWRTLQEMAGVVTPFTAQVRETAERDLAAAHEAEITSLRQEYEKRLASLRAEFEIDATARVTRGLMALAGYASDASTEGGGP